VNEHGIDSLTRYLREHWPREESSTSGALDLIQRYPVVKRPTHHIGSKRESFVGTLPLLEGPISVEIFHEGSSSIGTTGQKEVFAKKIPAVLKDDMGPFGPFNN
jgi:hypothetical protein